FDVDEDICRKISTDSYIISGKVEVDHLHEKYSASGGLSIEEGDYETLAGFITTKTGKIPAQGETLTIGNFRIQIVRANSKKIELVKLTVIQPSS
ncbi:MAG: transporter associated domain-containing protein, partial [Ignavibacteriaceae bacterium]